MDDIILDEMDLPLTNPNEDLETISKNQLRPLFDVAKFEIRSEYARDKGIDLHIEIKKTTRYTNFRFAVQLKATDTRQFNKDGSISLQLYTSNINYLLNYSMPAWYILFSKSTQVFYCENLNDFVARLNRENPDWQKQESHTLRFSKILSPGAIEEIYNDTIRRGIFHRKINEKLIMQSSALLGAGKVVLDPDFNVTSDQELRKLVEDFGFYVINEGNWAQVILLHKSGSQSIATTAKYNLVLGVANYYAGNVIDALSFLKAASKHTDELSPELVNHLSYFITSVKSDLGLLSTEEYRKQMEPLEDAEQVGLYISLEKAKNSYYETMGKTSEDRFKEFIAEVDQLVASPKADNIFKLNAHIELVLIKGSRNNWENVRQVAIINAAEIIVGPNPAMRKAAKMRFYTANSSWYKEVDGLKTEILESKNHFLYHNLLLNEVKTKYEMLVLTRLISIEQQSPEDKKHRLQDIQPVVRDLVIEVQRILLYYKNIGHIGNQIVALSIEYELQHYLQDFGTAARSLEEAGILAADYELAEKKRRLAYLKNGGTTHELCQAWKDEILADSKAKQQEVQGLIAEMMRLDQSERGQPGTTEGLLTIELLPIGRFTFPETQKAKVYEILPIPNKIVQAQFDKLFSMVIPIANIHYDEVKQEGPVDGNLGDRGIESWRNIYRVRKAFHDHKFYREQLTSE